MPGLMSWIVALENWDENVDIERAWGSVRNNFKTSVYESLLSLKQK
jgi:hypothetical protein